MNSFEEYVFFIGQLTINLPRKRITKLFVHFLITYINNITSTFKLYNILSLYYYIHTLRYYKNVHILIHLHIKIFADKLLSPSSTFAFLNEITFSFYTTRFNIAIHFETRYCRKSSYFSIEFHFKFTAVCRNSILFDASRGFYAGVIRLELKMKYWKIVERNLFSANKSRHFMSHCKDGLSDIAFNAILLLY